MPSVAERVGRRTPAELAVMRRAGRVVAEMHDVIRAALRPGVTTAALDRLARDVLDRRGASSNFLGYHGFPAVICASPNDVIVHGIPDDTVLDDGDLIGIDCGAVIDGWHADAAFTAAVGALDAEGRRLIEVADASLVAAIAEMVPGNRLGDVGAAVSEVVEAAGFSIVREYVGHGIGRAMHEAPDVPNYGRRGRGLRLEVGNVLAVEPMLNAGGAETVTLADGWGVVTADGSRSVHVEHTIAVTEHGPEVLTRP
jgi:methionyl aminopeptidase